VEVERPEVVRTVSWAASNGDRSENGDYIYGKRRRREIDRRVRFLMKRLEIAEVVDPRGQDRERVFFGATVISATAGQRADGQHRRHRRVDPSATIPGFRLHAAARPRATW
jgi:transcription elongation GreA/GreB family factor